MHELKKKVKEELYELEDKVKRSPNGRISDGDVQKLHILSDTYKNFCKIEKLEEEMGGGQSERGYSREGGNSYAGGGSYGGGNSYAGGGSYGGGEWRAQGSYGAGESYEGGMSERRRRDSMGRYSRDEGTEHVTKKLREIVNYSDPMRMKEGLRNVISSMERNSDD